MPAILWNDKAYEVTVTTSQEGLKNGGVEIMPVKWNQTSAILREAW